MPLVRIEILEGRSPSERRRLLHAVHAALVEAFGIPEDDRTQRVVEHAPDNFEIPPGRSARYTLVEITAFAGRSTPAKRALYQAIVRNLAAAGIPVQGSVRSECLDWTLVRGRRHLEAVLRTYVGHYKCHRPHRALGLRSPSGPQRGPHAAANSDVGIMRRPILGGLINEHRVAA